MVGFALHVHVHVTLLSSLFPVVQDAIFGRFVSNDLVECVGL